MNYKIIASGSKGNCIIINDVMVDCGVPFNKIKEELYGIKYLILTHVHSDHIKEATLLQIAANFPKIEIIGNYEVCQTFHCCKHVANTGFDIVLDDYTFTPFECIHDVLTYGYVWTYEGQKIIYATDTSSMEHAPEGKYDWFFIESNHDETKLEEVRNQRRGGYNPYLSGKRHLSTQQAKTFYYLNRSSNDAPFIELHKSSRFY